MCGYMYTRRQRTLAKNNSSILHITVGLVRSLHLAVSGDMGYSVWSIQYKRYEWDRRESPHCYTKLLLEFCIRRSGIVLNSLASWGLKMLCDSWTLQYIVLIPCLIFQGLFCRRKKVPSIPLCRQGHFARLWLETGAYMAQFPSLHGLITSIM